MWTAFLQEIEAAYPVLHLNEESLERTKHIGIVKRWECIITSVIKDCDGIGDSKYAEIIKTRIGIAYQVPVTVLGEFTGILVQGNAHIPCQEDIVVATSQCRYACRKALVGSKVVTPINP